MIPTHEQLCTLCEKAAAHLLGLKMQLDANRQQAETLQKHIIAQQGVLAALQVATGERYNEDTVPMTLDY